MNDVGKENGESDEITLTNNSIIQPITSMTLKDYKEGDGKRLSESMMVQENIDEMMRLGYFFPSLKTKLSTNETERHFPDLSSLYEITSSININDVEEENTLVGLRNNGQICFMNSILQALVPLQSFTLYLKLIKERNNALGATSMQFINSLYTMVTSLSGQNKLSKRLLKASEILQLVGKKHSQFSSAHPLLDQQDAQEFFQAIMSIISNDAENCYSSFNLYPRHNPLLTTSSALWFLLNVPHPYTMIPSNSRQEIAFKEEKKQHDYDEQIYPIKTNKHPHRRSIQILLSSTPPSFNGWTGSMLQCATCKHTKPIQNTPFYDIPILPNSTNIHQSLQQFFNTEVIDNVNCYNCTIKSKLESFSLELNSLNRVIRKRQLKYKSQTQMYDGLLQERQSCIKEIQSLQSIDPDEDDEECVDVHKSHAYKSLFISRLPPVLILHIQRKYYNPNVSQMVKVTKHISFSQVIDISLFVPNADDKILYQLQSVVEHIGNANNGHYQTFRRCGDRWIRCSDEIVEYVSWDRVKLVQAYMLFYEAL